MNLSKLRLLNQSKGARYFCKKKTLFRHVLKPSNACPVSQKVVPSTQLDPCRSQIEEVSSKLKGFVIGDDSDLDKFLKKGEISQASQLAITVLQSANEETKCGQTLGQDTKTLVGLLTVCNIFFKLAVESCVFVCFYAFFPDNLLVFLMSSTSKHLIHLYTN